ncbi:MULTISPECIES: nitrite reductase small subunit NirD [Streptomyces]|uniref:Nitrite reductase small subunit n=1 Tax=Streptomyces violaceoruber TaxID=1935 RepID=A0A1V0U8X8_STRVN|nr:MULTISPECIES: nitrite reductase small subunit NirD [Streptomyces]ARF61577.1 nitrite reductase small subunit [Streptomyces violaceoruber]
MTTATITTTRQSTPSATPATSATPDTPATSATGAVRLAHGDGWFTVCDRGLLTPGRGVSVLLPDGDQAAVFLDRSGRVHAVGNRDPFTGAYVLARGLLGSAGGRPFVASPLLKQRFDLTTGACLDDEDVSVPVFAVRVE